MTRQTSMEVFKQIRDGGLLSRMRLETYQLLFDHGPMTAGELYTKARSELGNDSLRDNHQKRLPELRDMGVVKEIGTKLCAATGQNVILWDVTENLPSGLPKKVPKNVRIRDLESAIKVSILTLSESGSQPALVAFLQGLLE